MPTCPNCKHHWIVKKSKPSSAYENYGVRFADGVFMLVGGYSCKELELRDKAISRRALALSGGRFLDRSQLKSVPAIVSLERIDFEELPKAREVAFEQRISNPGWGRSLDGPFEPLY